MCLADSLLASHCSMSPSPKLVWALPTSLCRKAAEQPKVSQAPGCSNLINSSGHTMPVQCLSRISWIVRTLSRGQRFGARAHLLPVTVLIFLNFENASKKSEKNCAETYSCIHHVQFFFRIFRSIFIFNKNRNSNREQMSPGTKTQIGRASCRGRVYVLV